VSPTLTALTNLNEGHIDSHAKKKAIDDAMNWLRNNDPNRPTWTIRQGLANLLGYMPGRLSPEEKAQWLRIQ
jgi:hypothetical protein